MYKYKVTYLDPEKLCEIINIFDFKHSVVGQQVQSTLKVENNTVNTIHVTSTSLMFYFFNISPIHNYHTTIHVFNVIFQYQNEFSHTCINLV